MDAARTVLFKTWEVAGGDPLREEIRLQQEPLVRALGNQIYEVREMLNGDEATMKYTVGLTPSSPIEWISQQLMPNPACGVKAVSWSEPPKKG